MAGVVLARRAVALPMRQPLWRTFATAPHVTGSFAANEAMKRSKPTTALEKTPATRWTEQSDATVEFLVTPPSPYAGRTVTVAPGQYAAGFVNLNKILQFNKVQQELRAGERHEKKGDKRRRLKSVRWRRVFAAQVRKKVQLVQDILRRGA